MPPRRKKQKQEVPWADQPVVETFETPYGRLRTVEGPKTRNPHSQTAKIFLVDDDGGLIKTHGDCKVTIGRAGDRDAVIERYRKYHDEETMEAAARPLCARRAANCVSNPHQTTAIPTRRRPH